MSHQSIGLDERFQGPYRTSPEVKNRRCYGPLSAPAVCMVRWPKLGALEPKFEFFRRLDFNIFLRSYFTDSWTMKRSPGNRFGVFAQCLGGRKNSHQLKHMVFPIQNNIFLTFGRDFFYLAGLRSRNDIAHAIKLIELYSVGIFKMSKRS